MSWENQKHLIANTKINPQIKDSFPEKREKWMKL